MFRGFLVGREKGGMEDGVNLPQRGNAEVEGCMGDNFFHLEGARSLHLEFLGSIRVEIGGFKPYFISFSPRGELGGYLFLHFLLGYFVGSLGIITSSVTRSVQKVPGDF